MIRMMSHLTGIYFGSESAGFDENIRNLLGQLSDKQRMISLVFFGASNDGNYEQELEHIQEKLNASFENNTPLVSYIAQSLPEPQKMALEVHYLPESVNVHAYSQRAIMGHDPGHLPSGRHLQKRTTG